MANHYELTETLYLTDDRKRAVKAGDKSAAFLLGVKGQKISAAVAEKLGLRKPDAGSEVSNRDPSITNRDLVDSRNANAPIVRKVSAATAPSIPAKKA